MTYGKTVGGGLPVGVVCGPHRFMKRFREDHPADICFARGTFNSHPYVMAAMNEFLRHLDGPEMAALYRDLDATWAGRAASLNRRLAERGLPLQVAALSSLIWTVCHTAASRYNWMLAILPRGPRPGAELGRHRPAGLQPELQRRRLRGRGRALPGRRRSDAPRRLVGDRRTRLRPRHQAPHPARDDPRRHRPVAAEEAPA